MDWRDLFGFARLMLNFRFSPVARIFFDSGMLFLITKD